MTMWTASSQKKKREKTAISPSDRTEIMIDRLLLEFQRRVGNDKLDNDVLLAVRDAIYKAYLEGMHRAVAEPEIVKRYRRREEDKKNSILIRDIELSTSTTRIFPSIPQPTHYKLALDCKHQPIMTPEQISGAIVETRYNAATHTDDDVIVCPLCKEHAPGSFDYTMLHKVVAMTPMYARQVRREHEHNEQPTEQQQQEPEQRQPE